MLRVPVCTDSPPGEGRRPHCWLAAVGGRRSSIVGRRSGRGHFVHKQRNEITARTLAHTRDTGAARTLRARDGSAAGSVSHSVSLAACGARIQSRQECVQGGAPRGTGARAALSRCRRHWRAPPRAAHRPVPRAPPCRRRPALAHPPVGVSALISRPRLARPPFSRRSRVTLPVHSVHEQSCCR
ncbi:unnamed protein product [Euphydryas editha]|uniref:Uncharacterized protein n=1 Tax=Euphydryas editha TaxID=104508 RepID=A0AAU9V548_EUPED|nr:unnamed protein product [Euphydryas editha]